jgi:hypothetical protein
MGLSIEYVCVSSTVGDGHVEIRTLGTLMAALVMLNVLNFGNCGHIVTIATCGQIDGENRRYSSQTTNNERHRLDSVYGFHVSSLILEWWRVNGR